MPLDLDDIEPLLSDAETAFRRGGQETEDGLDVSDAGFVQLRKACRSLSGGDRLLEDGFYTLVIEAAFTSIEKTFLFWLIDEGHQDPANPPQSHTTAIKRGAAVGLISTDTADRLEDLWTENRAQTYYQDAKATRERAEAMVALANRIHTLVVNLVGVRHECVCGWPTTAKPISRVAGTLLETEDDVFMLNVSSTHDTLQGSRTTWLSEETCTQIAAASEPNTLEHVADAVRLMADRPHCSGGADAYELVPLETVVNPDLLMEESTGRQ